VVRCSAAGALVWGPVTMCGAANDQFNEVATSDGAGGIIMAWKDDRSGVQHDIYAGRVTISGSVALGWLTDGNPVCKASGTKDNPAIASDGAGGAFVAWSDYRFSPSEPDIFALRILPGGNQPFGWPIDGQAITTSSGSQYERGLVSDGAGGAIIVWEDTRVDPGYSDVFASRVLPNGAAAPGWLNGGTPLCTAGNFQRFPVICTDGAGGAIVAWTDSRTGTPKAYAQNVDLFGQLGDARPTSAGIKDVKADQGGHVRMTWNASYLDANPLYAVSSYWIWRQTPASVAAAAVSDGGTWADVPSARSDAVVADAPPHAARLFRHADDATAGYAWEFVSSQPSNGSLQYSFVAPTVSDSVAGYNPYTVFMVEARGTSNGTFWDSSPDSAYSVDNLPPFTPAPFTANFSVGVTHLHWGRNLEPDLANYRLYRGRSAAFVPGASNLVASPADTGYADMAPPDSYYKLSAVDAHGNESDFALVSPPAGLDVNDHPALVLALARPAPNPARSAPRIGFSLAHDTHVSLSIYDIAGRRERTLVEGLLPAGEHAQVWDLRDASGAIVHDGLYLVRMEADGKRFTERLIVAQ